MENLAGVLYLLGYIPYLWHIARDKRAKPLWAPWLIFSAVESILLWETRVAGTDTKQLWCSTAGSWVTFGFASAYGERGFKPLDGWCLMLALASVAVWWATSHLAVGIAMSSGAIAIGMIPIFASAWENPEAEDKAGWTLFFASCVLAVMAIPEWTWASAAQPVSFLATETIAVILLWGPWVKRKLTAKS